MKSQRHDDESKPEPYRWKSGNNKKTPLKYDQLSRGSPCAQFARRIHNRGEYIEMYSIGSTDWVG